MATELEYEDIVRYKTSTDSKYRCAILLCSRAEALGGDKLSRRRSQAV